MELVDIFVYPVKALRGGTHQAAEIDPWGLRGDRNWMVVDEGGRFITQREYANMALIRAENTEDGLRLANGHGGQISVPIPGEGAPQIAVTVWRDTVPAALATADVNAWLGERIGLPCRLVYLRDKTARRIDPAYALDGEPVSFADGFPILLTSMASLADLNTRLARPIPIGRFRPNLVVTGERPWEEDGWRRIRIGAATFRVVKGCERCIVTTVDPETGERPDKTEPLRTLGKFRRNSGGGVVFGQNLIPERLGRISVGDTLEVLERGPPNVDIAGGACDDFAEGPIG